MIEFARAAEQEESRLRVWERCPGFPDEYRRGLGASDPEFFVRAPAEAG